MSETLSGAQILCRTLVDERVQDAAELADTVREAVAVALDGRPGPVLLDVPKDVQNQKAEYHPAQPLRDPRAGARGQSLTPGASPGSEEGVREAARLIAEAERPLLMVGHGVILADAYAEIRGLAERTGIPVITTLLGISAFPECHPLHLGMPGMHGEVHVNRAIQHADLIVGIGLRFDDRVTGNTAAFAPRARIVHVDCDPAEIGKNVKAAVGVHLARPDEPVWAISGDGGFQMNMAEIATMVQEGLAVKMAVFNNGYLGMVRQWQQFFHGKRYSCTPIWSPDYVKLAAAYGIPGWRVERARELEEVVTEANAVRGAELLRAADAVAREVALVRVHAPTEVHQELAEIAELFKAELVDEGPDVFVLQVTGAAWFILSFIRALERFGIIEVARSGAVVVRSAAPASRPSTSAAETVL